MLKLSVLISIALFSISSFALEVQGFLTAQCERIAGVIIYVDDDNFEFIDLQGRHHEMRQQDVQAVYVFNVIDNPFEKFQVDDKALARLKALYAEDTEQPTTLAFPVRYIEDLVIFYSLEGKSHVHTLGDIHKLRPAPQSAHGEHKAKSYKPMVFEFTDQSIKCPQAPSTANGVKPTRVLADKISVSDFFKSFEQGYESLESFQERTYLYARPFLFEKSMRLGFNFISKGDEPAINFPAYFQWSTGKPYRFQSFTVAGSKVHEFLPNTEPVFSLRSDVKSHIFHGLFIGNVAGVAAGSAVFLRSSGLGLGLPDEMTVQPSFNYLAMMGGDYGPFSASVGFFYASYGIKVGMRYREVRGVKPSYAVRAMYTRKKIRLRAIGSISDYKSGSPRKGDISGKLGENGYVDDQNVVNSYSFNSRFLRAGMDYQFSDRVSYSLDGVSVIGNYKEDATIGVSNSPMDISFNRFAIQNAITLSFSDYASFTGYVNLLQNTFEANVSNSDQDREQRESKFFGSFEFIF